MIPFSTQQPTTRPHCLTRPQHGLAPWSYSAPWSCLAPWSCSAPWTQHSSPATNKNSSPHQFRPNNQVGLLLLQQLHKIFAFIELRMKNKGTTSNRKQTTQPQTHDRVHKLINQKKKPNLNSCLHYPHKPIGDPESVHKLTGKREAATRAKLLSKSRCPKQSAHTDNQSGLTQSNPKQVCSPCKKDK